MILAHNGVKWCIILRRKSTLTFWRKMRQSSGIAEVVGGGVWWIWWDVLRRSVGRG